MKMNDHITVLIPVICVLTIIFYSEAIGQDGFGHKKYLIELMFSQYYTIFTL